jgi:DNA-binding NarL/FixJ family response regulator
MSLNLYIDTTVTPIIEGNMADFINGYSFYPVINHAHELIGTIDEDSIFSYKMDSISIDPLLIITTEIHPLECVRKFQQAESNILFLVTNGQYLGSVTQASIFDYFQDKIEFTPEQSILELSIESTNFSIADITRIVESESAQVTYFSAKEDMNLGLKLITITVNKSDIQRIVGILENKEYQVLQIFNEGKSNHHLQDRYEHLMHYLNI